MYGRFSKANVGAWVSDRIANIQREWNFDPGNGTAQCTSGRADESRAYGEYRALLDLVAEFDLSCTSRGYDRNRHPRRQ